MIKKLIKKTFYYLVYLKYIKNTTCFICNSSRLFRLVWINNKEYILKDANLFLKMNPEINNLVEIHCDTRILFLNKDEKINTEQMKHVRIQFLHWMVLN